MSSKKSSKPGASKGESATKSPGRQGIADRVRSAPKKPRARRPTKSSVKDERDPAAIAAQGARRPRAAPHPLARTTTPGRRPAAKASGLGRPRIRATHAEGGDGRLSETEVERRRVRAKASVRSLGGGRVAPRQLPPPPSKRESTGPRSGPAKRRSTAPQSSPSTESQELALAIAAAGLDKKAVGVEVIDVSGRVDYADFLVIMTGTSDRHVHAIAMGIDEALKRKKILPLSVEGLGAASWVLMDFADVVVHVFQEDTRRIYDIEGLWMDASRLNVLSGPST